MSLSVKAHPPRIVIVGSANIDLVTRAARLPGPGETVVGTRFDTVPGGKSANQAVACARLGATAHFVGKVGTDTFGSLIEHSFTTAGVNTDLLVRDHSVASGTALISVSDQTGENTIIVVAGANGNLSVSDVSAASSLISSADALIVSLEVPLLAVQTALEIASTAGVMTVLNPAPAMALPDLMVSLCSIMTPNEHEAALISGSSESPGSSARALIARGAGIVVVTLGPKGALVVGPDGMEKLVDAVTATKVVDTTAAGDCYTSALVVALCEGKDLASAMHFAAAAAAITVSRPGAQTSLPTRSEVDNLVAISC